MKNISRKLRLEAQVAEKGYLEWEDIVQYVECCAEYTHLFKFFAEGCDLGDLREKLESGFKISYVLFKEIEIEFLEDLKNNYNSLFKYIMEL